MYVAGQMSHYLLYNWQLTVLVDQVHAVRGVDAVQVVPIIRPHRHAPENQILQM